MRLCAQYFRARQLCSQCHASLEVSSCVTCFEHNRQVRRQSDITLRPWHALDHVYEDPHPRARRQSGTPPFAAPEPHALAR